VISIDFGKFVGGNKRLFGNNLFFECREKFLAARPVELAV